MSDQSVSSITNQFIYKFNFNDTNNVQIGNQNRVDNLFTNQLKEDMEYELDVKNDQINKLTDQVETLTCGMNQLTERVKILEDEKVVKKTDVNKNSDKKTQPNKNSDKTDGMITLKIYPLNGLEYDMAISRDETVDELEKMIQDRKKYGRDDDKYIGYIHSEVDQQDKYNYKQHNKHHPLSHYNITSGDTVFWW